MRDGGAASESHALSDGTADAAQHATAAGGGGGRSRSGARGGRRGTAGGRGRGGTLSEQAAEAAATGAGARGAHAASAATTAAQTRHKPWTRGRTSGASGARAACKAWHAEKAASFGTDAATSRMPAQPRRQPSALSSCKAAQTRRAGNGRGARSPRHCIDKNAWSSWGEECALDGGKTCCGDRSSIVLGTVGASPRLRAASLNGAGHRPPPGLANLLFPPPEAPKHECGGDASRMRSWRPCWHALGSGCESRARHGRSRRKDPAPRCHNCCDCASIGRCRG